MSNKKLDHHLNDEVEDDEETISTATSSSSADSTMADNSVNTHVIKSVNVSNASLSSSELSSDHELTKSKESSVIDGDARRSDRQGTSKPGKSNTSSKKPNRLQKNAAPFNGYAPSTATTTTMQVHQGPVLPQQLGGVSAQPYHHQQQPHHPILPTSPYTYYTPNAPGSNIPPPPMMAPVFAPPSNSSSSSSSSTQHLVHQFVGPNGQLDQAHWPPHTMTLAYGPDPMGSYYNYPNAEFYSPQNHFEPLTYGTYTPTVPYSYTGDYSTAATTNNSSTNLSVTTSNATTVHAADSKKHLNGTEATAMHSTSSSSASSASSWSPSSSQNNKVKPAKNTASTNSPSKQQPNNDSSAVSSASTSSSNLLQQNPLSMPTYSNGSSLSSGLPFQNQWIRLDQHSHQIPPSAYHYQIPPLSFTHPSQTNGRNTVNGNGYFNRQPTAHVFPHQTPVPFAPGKAAHHTTYFSTAAPAPHHQPIELSPYHHDPSSTNSNYHDYQHMPPSSGNRGNKLEISFNAMNLNENDMEQAYYEHQHQPAGFNYNRYKSKSKKNGRLNYTSNQYRSAQNRMSRGHYQDDMMPESAKGANFENQVNEMNNAEFDQRNESNNQFELQDYKRTLNKFNKRDYGSDQLTSDGTPFISGDSATSSASHFSSDQYQRLPKSFNKPLSYKQQQYREYQRQQQKQYGSSFDYDNYRLSHYHVEENFPADDQPFDSKTGATSQRRPSSNRKNEFAGQNLKSGSFSSSSSNVNHREQGDELSRYQLDDQGQRRKEKERGSRNLPAQPTIFSFLSKADKKNLFQSEPAAEASATENQENKAAISQPETVAQHSIEPEESSKLVQNPPKAVVASSRGQREAQLSVIVPEPIVDFTSSKQLIEHKYNPCEFITSPKQARFFVIKSYSEDDIHRSIKYGIWCSTEHGNRRLDQAFSRGLNNTRDRQPQTEPADESQIRVPVYLFFSVNGSGHFCGMAQMLSRVDYNSKASIWSQQDKWRGCFQVKWIYVKDIPNSILRNIRLENNENKPVTNSRDTQEIPFEKGKQVLKIFHTFNHTSSIFDDFEHYENLQNKASPGDRARSTESESTPTQACPPNTQPAQLIAERKPKYTGKQQTGGERDPTKTSRNPAPSGPYSYQQKRATKENSATTSAKTEEKTEPLNMNNLLMFPSLSESMTMPASQKESVSSKIKAKSISKSEQQQQKGPSSSSSSLDKGAILESILIDNNNNSDKNSDDAVSAPTFTEPSEENKTKPSALVK